MSSREEIDLFAVALGDVIADLKSSREDCASFARGLETLLADCMATLADEQGRFEPDAIGQITRLGAAYMALGIQTAELARRGQAVELSTRSPTAEFSARGPAAETSARGQMAELSTRGLSTTGPEQAGDTAATPRR